MKSIKIKQHICPNCNYHMDAVTPISDDNDNIEQQGPQENDLTLCFNCGQILQFQKDLSVIPVKIEDLHDLDEITLETFLNWQKAILNRVKCN